MRSTELRVTDVIILDSAAQILAESDGKPVRLVARRAQADSEADLNRVDALVRSKYSFSAEEKICFLEVERTDASEFDQCLCVEGRRVGPHHVLSAKSPVVANSIAALLIHIEKTTGEVPHAYFKWKEGNPVANVFRFIFLGEGDAAPVTHEVLRRAVPDLSKRPVIHVS